MKRPFKSKRPIGPFATLDEDKQIDIPRKVKGSAASQSYIYYLLANEGKLTVAEIHKTTGLSISVIREQLGNLDNKGHLEVEQTDGNTVYAVANK
jgi:Fic family protein